MTPLGALPRLSPTTRRALVACGLLAAGDAAALVAQAWTLGYGIVAAIRGEPVTGWLAGLALAIAARAAFGWATQVASARAAAGAKAELRQALLDRSLALGPEWIARRGAGELTALATRGLDALDAYFTRYLPALVTALVVPLGVGAAIALADWVSAVLVAITVPLIPIFGYLVGTYTADRVSRAADATERLSGHLFELVRALPVLTAFRRAHAQVDAVRRVSQAHRIATLDTLKVAFSSAFVLELAATLSVALVAVGIGLRLVAGDLSLAIGLMVLILAPECYLPLRAVGAAHHASEDGVEAVRRVAEVLDRPVPEPGTKPVPEGAVRVEGLKVRRRDGYAPDGVSFTARPGEIVRLDSPSGSGKSTTFGVLLGFVRPDAGQVRVGEVDLTEIDPVAWRRRVAWVPQRPAFAGGTVADEMALAVADSAGVRNPRAASDPLTVADPPSRAELVSVARQVAADHLLDRHVSELSTGERQRVAVARALLRVRHGARLLLLDEPTAHLDEATASRVMAAVREAARGGVAVVLAAHRTAEAKQPDVASSPVTERATTASAGVRARLADLVTRRTIGGALLGAGALLCGVALTATSAWLIAKAAQQPPILTLAVAIVGVRAFGLGRAALRYVERLVTHDAAFRTAGELRARLWEALVRLGPAQTVGLRQGEGLRRMVDDVDTVRDLTPRVLVPPLVVAAVCAVAVGVQTAVLPEAGVVLAIAVLVAGLGGAVLAVTTERHAATALADGRRRIAAGVLTLVRAAADLIAYGAASRFQAELADEDAALTRRARRQAFGSGASAALITAATGAATVLGLWLAAGAVTEGRLDPVLATVVALLPLTLTEVVLELPPAFAHLDALRTAQTRVAATVAAADHVTAQPRSLVRVTDGAIRLDGVDVRWPGTPQPALRELRCHIPAGTWVAVTGPSGAGKSTLLALLLGFLPPERGEAALPEQVAWCPQEPQLVSTTVRENLRLGDPHADDARLIDALEVAGLGHWRDRLDTRLGTGEAATSGGEAQRLALARAVLAAENASLVLLDEPTAHLDRPTAATVLANLRRRLAGRTVVHVTHHADEAVMADLVIEVRDGTAHVRWPTSTREPAVVAIAS